MSETILKKVKRIEVATRRVMDDFMSGGYKSRFKGQGVQFSEHRVYTPGDDIRHLDWKVTARSKEPLIKQFEEERELNVFIIADLSCSQDFGSKTHTKKQLVAELGAMIAYAASTSGDKVGVLFVTNQVKKIIELKKGRNHVLRIIRDLLTHPTEPGGTDLKSALEETRRLLKHAGIVFIISDFHHDQYETPLRQLAKKHDVVALKIEDPSEGAFPAFGSLTLIDPETEQEVDVYPSQFVFQKESKENHQKFEKKTKQIFNQSGVEMIPVTTYEDYANSLVRFLRRRKQKR